MPVARAPLCRLGAYPLFAEDRSDRSPNPLVVQIIDGSKGAQGMRGDGEPGMRLLDGDGMSADDAAWSMVADAAAVALKLPGLSAACASRFERLHQASIRAAGLPPPQSPQAP
jgi:hypothetical protein